ncbi:uncharacterized protein ACLA_016540 [Aspergillus clavatus NRRL 1]|uniref:Uncharacterized protein n=1 Tax=Aspergillus clavatus (strain ATCC 1007 / CBS 513.65 / DSM 816 / NCTC 3887 / NRRL 1 / QM 1276 / 107) TaxID=344612 RepID=A1CBU0_ASPCL|nr:uncharacterized protein ACLA_016540 [Aspergillus clavatus NRRL 1]EAW13208.1 hypothetical protein ACLA_016540 [Aspergillus clavatus NRRL 1]
MSVGKHYADSTVPLETPATRPKINNFRRTTATPRSPNKTQVERTRRIKDSNLKVTIHLDLVAEVDIKITAQLYGDIVVGLL